MTASRSHQTASTSSGALVGAALGALLLGLAVSSAALAGSGLVALQTADPSCGGAGGGRFAVCGNGTVTDTQTGLVWLADADCLGAAHDWVTALEFVAGLADIEEPGGSFEGHECGLDDGSSAGEWRLPSIAEWEAMVRDAAALGCDPAISDVSGTGCCADPETFCPFSNLQSSAYWSATTSVLDTDQAWRIFLPDGTAGVEVKLNPVRVWAVRGGQ